MPIGTCPEPVRLLVSACLLGDCVRYDDLADPVRREEFVAAVLARSRARGR